MCKDVISCYWTLQKPYETMDIAKLRGAANMLK